MGISNLSKIQALALDDFLNGTRDMAIISDTGTGKTLLYAVAAVNFVDSNNKKLQVLCICGTYEAAMQTAKVFTQVAMYTPVKIDTVLKNAKSKYYDLFCFISIDIINF